MPAMEVASRVWSVTVPLSRMTCFPSFFFRRSSTEAAIRLVTLSRRASDSVMELSSLTTFSIHAIFLHLFFHSGALVAQRVAFRSTKPLPLRCLSVEASSTTPVHLQRESIDSAEWARKSIRPRAPNPTILSEQRPFGVCSVLLFVKKAI
jgi:hypothetical protein